MNTCIISQLGTKVYFSTQTVDTEVYLCIHKKYDSKRMLKIGVMKAFASTFFCSSKK